MIIPQVGKEYLNRGLYTVSPGEANVPHWYAPGFFLPSQGVQQIL